MAGAHETMEKAEHATHAAASNKQIALLISVLALFLAFAETLGKSTQTAAISENVVASNLWAFFQAKTIRMTSVRTAAEAMEVEASFTQDSTTKDAMRKRIASWQSTAARYDDEPETGEGRKQLVARAKEAEHKRDLAMARYHHYEVASAALQIAIVLASATIITSMMPLAWISVALGVTGLAFIGIGWFVPEAVHLF